jgi:murein DD-endopeptidase MepM/ murein hydrolase activator NlpD
MFIRVTTLFCFFLLSAGWAYNLPDPSLDTVVNLAPYCFYPDSAKDRLYKLPFDSGRTILLADGSFNRSYGSHHKGYEWDFPTPWGTPIIAARSGYVGFIGRLGGNGDNCIQINKSARCTTSAYTVTDYYLHVQVDSPIVKIGQKIEQGQLFCYTGQVGMFDHLHFEAQMQGHVGVGWKYDSAQYINSIPVPFVEDLIDPDGILWGQKFYTSRNKRYVVPNAVESSTAKSAQTCDLLTVRPNPVRTSAVVTLQGASGDVVVRVINARGERVSLLRADGKTIGLGLRWNAGSLPSGVYWVCAVDQGKTFRSRILLLK